MGQIQKKILLGDFSHILWIHSSFFGGFMGKFCLNYLPPKTQGKRHGTIYKIFGMPLKGPRKLFRPPPPTVPWSQMAAVLTGILELDCPGLCFLFKVYSFQKKQHLVVSFKLQEIFHFSRKTRESLFFGESFNLTWNKLASVKFHPGDAWENDLKSEIL